MATPVPIRLGNIILRMPPPPVPEAYVAPSQDAEQAVAAFERDLASAKPCRIAALVISESGIAMRQRRAPSAARTICVDLTTHGVEAEPSDLVDVLRRSFPREALLRLVDLAKVGSEADVSFHSNAIRGALLWSA